MIINLFLLFQFFFRNPSFFGPKQIIAKIDLQYVVLRFPHIEIAKKKQLVVISVDVEPHFCPELQG